MHCRCSWMSVHSMRFGVTTEADDQRCRYKVSIGFGAASASDNGRGRPNLMVLAHGTRVPSSITTRLQLELFSVAPA
jgi:hypothetical protein